MAYTNKNPNINEAPDCLACQTPMILREKEGSQFWGCRNWKECGGKTIPFDKKPKAQEGVKMVKLEEAKKIFATEVFRRFDVLEAEIKELKRLWLNK